MRNQGLGSWPARRARMAPEATAVVQDGGSLSYDMYISGGENVYPAEVEQLLYQHPAVDECAVIGVPDERWGEVGRALVVPRPGSDVSPDDIMDSLSGRLAKYKLPKSVVLVDTLPRNATGKILKARLRSQHGSVPAHGAEEA